MWARFQAWNPMRTVSGTVISTKPITLSQATASLSKFVSAHNGASQAMQAYLRRTLASFKDLQKSSASSHKRKHRSSEFSDSEPSRKKHRRWKCKSLSDLTTDWLASLYFIILVLCVRENLSYLLIIMFGGDSISLLSRRFMRTLVHGVMFNLYVLSLNLLSNGL